MRNNKNLMNWNALIGYTIESSTNMIFGSLLMKIYELHMERQLQIWPGRPSGPKSIRGPWYKWSVGLLQWSDLLWANQHMLLLTSLHPSFFSPTPLWQDLLRKLPNFLLTGASLSARYSHRERAQPVWAAVDKSEQSRNWRNSASPWDALLRSSVVAWG